MYSQPLGTGPQVLSPPSGISAGRSIGPSYGSAGPSDGSDGPSAGPAGTSFGSAGPSFGLADGFPANTQVTPTTGPQVLSPPVALAGRKSKVSVLLQVSSTLLLYASFYMNS